MSMPDDQIRQFDEILRTNGFLLARRTKKVREYQSRKGHTVYLGVEQGRPPWRLTIHPESAVNVTNSPGIEQADLYHNSNMLAFPERAHTGDKLVDYGRRLKIIDPRALDVYLQLLDRTPLPTG
jgi:hypothetical protein